MISQTNGASPNFKHFKEKAENNVHGITNLK